MGVAVQYLTAMDELGVFSNRAKILDIGSSNLYGAHPTILAEFIRKYRPRAIQVDVETLANKLAEGSYYEPGVRVDNTAFIGELFEAAGMEYQAFDIADGYRTQILDMNRESLPKKYKGYYDVVLNFGTTEHIFNQFNSFQIIHDATKVGGHIVHQLPSVGFTDHCYFTYNGRFFFDLAGYNQYEIVDFSFTGPAGEADVFASVTMNSHRLPILREIYKRQKAKGDRSPLNGVHVPNVAITVVYRKVNDKPFVAALERQTSVGEIPDTVSSSY